VFPPAPPLLAIVGPTAAGKTDLAVALGGRFGGEIINADSRQVYRHMDVGTAKPTSLEQRRVSHHLLDVADPADSFSLGTFLTLARELIPVISQRGHQPILAGGTGQYVWALLEGWQVPVVPPDPEFRTRKLREAEAHGGAVLHAELRAIDPQRAAELDPRNLRRVIRALEIHRFTGRPGFTGSPPSALAQGRRRSVTAFILGLTMERERLYQRIDDRVDQMMEQGFLEEVEKLGGMGYRLGQGSLASPGYRELGQYLEGELSIEEAVQRTKYQTHRLARRQYTWFKPNDPRIRWLNGQDPNVEEQAAQLVEEYLRSAPPVIQ
jgi:tRNA dimethylallyltransferase